MLAVVAFACGPSQTLPELTDETTEPAVTQTTSKPRPVFGPITAVEPAFIATIATGVTQSIVDTARGVPGVAAAARIALMNMKLDTGQALGDISVMAVDPEEFRPLAPAVTVQAPFVWERLYDGEIVLAHEEHRRLGITSGQRVFADTASGRTALRVGAVAANGVPNIAGAMLGRGRARLLAFGEATQLMIGIAEGQKKDAVKKALGKVLIGLKFQDVPSRNRAFLMGTSAERAIGSFSFTPNGDGTITQDPAWVAKHITSKPVPILGKVTCHRVMLRQMGAAFAEIESKGLTHLIDTKQYGGCYVPRFIGRNEDLPLSKHAWGLAFDINVSTNLQGNQPQLDPRIVEIMENWGFRWGGRWSNPDGMHFELAALLK